MIPGSEGACHTVAEARTHLDDAATYSAIRGLEAKAAEHYWRAWSNVPVRFARRDVPRTPAHWHHVGPRGSPLTGSAQRAVTPAHAMLNLMLALLESEARIACVTIGLDPGLGLLHYDQQSRHSFALDLMEPGRPAIEAQLVGLLDSHAFRRSDFTQEPDGNVRIAPELARQLCQTTITDEVVGRHAEAAAKLLGRAAVRPPNTVPTRDPIHVPTRLTGKHRSEGRDQYRNRPPKQPRTRAPAVEPACKECGAPLPNRDRVVCDSCLPIQNRQRLDHYREIETARRAATGDHPQSRPEVREKLAHAQRLHWERRAASPDAPGYTGHPSEFNRLIRPLLAGLSPALLADKTGLSKGYVAQIRDGRHTPHPRHWPALHQIGLDAKQQRPPGQPWFS